MGTGITDWNERERSFNIEATQAGAGADHKLFADRAWGFACPQTLPVWRHQGTIPNAAFKITFKVRSPGT